MQMLINVLCTILERDIMAILITCVTNVRVPALYVLIPSLLHGCFPIRLLCNFDLV